MKETILVRDYSRVLIKYENFFSTRYEIWDAEKFQTHTAAELVNGHYIRHMRSFICDSDQIAKELFYGV
jgi:hypothetical protein